MSGTRRGTAKDRRGAPATVLLGGIVYFLLVFGVGFLLGVVRTLWLVPRLGVRRAELVEIPIMLLVIYLAARWTSDRLGLEAHSRRVRLGVGLLALFLLLAAELLLVLQLRGLTVAEYIASRDPVAGTTYGLSLVVFAAMPALVGRRANR
jgi:uncharacterized protein YqgC (DUF456 family)